MFGRVLRAVVLAIACAALIVAIGLLVGGQPSARPAGVYLLLIAVGSVVALFFERRVHREGS